MKIDHSFETCDKFNDKRHLRNILIECTIIIIVQYTIAENITLVFQCHKIIIKSISITHYCNIGCRITNIPLWTVSKHWVRLPKTGRFWYWGLLAPNMVNNNRALFEISSSIKIQSTPRSGLGQSLKMTGYSSRLMHFFMKPKV